MWKLGKLRLRHRKGAKVERRFFEVVFEGLLQDMTAEDAPVPSSLHRQLAVIRVAPRTPKPPSDLR